MYSCHNNPSGVASTIAPALCGLALLLCGILAAPMSVQAEEIPKFLLMQLTRDQSRAFCSSSTFTQCMGFTETQCIDLSEKAIEDCLGPLPDNIDPAKLDNAQLEQCPQKIYSDAGFEEEKAKMCFKEAIDELQKP